MPRTNKSTFLVLGLLSEQPKSGYDIKTEVEEVIGHFWKESFGQIYPVLSRLCRQGLVKKSSVPNGARRRHVYAITAKGTAELQRWLRMPPEVETVRNELLLKVYFARHLPTPVLVGHIEAFRDRVKAREQVFKQTERALAAETDASPRDHLLWSLTLRMGLLTSRARLAWAEEALERLATSA